jgi:hypothetical protein
MLFLLYKTGLFRYHRRLVAEGSFGWQGSWLLLLERRRGGVGVNLHAVVHIRYRVVEVPEVRAGLLSRYTSSAGFDRWHEALRSDLIFPNARGK